MSFDFTASDMRLKHSLLMGRLLERKLVFLKLLSGTRPYELLICTVHPLKVLPELMYILQNNMTGKENNEVLSFVADMKKLQPAESCL